MSRKSRIVDDSISALRERIAQLHYEKANLRLWKEKDAADAQSEIEELRSRLNSLQASMRWQLRKVVRQILSIARSIRTSVRKSSSAACTVLGQPAESAAPLSATCPAAASTPASRHSLNRHASGFIIQGKAAWDAHAQRCLREFLEHAGSVIFPVVERPTISIVIVSYNSPHFLLLSLLSIADHADLSYEVIIVDNDSGTDTLKLLERVQGATIIKNSVNRGFPAACMQGVIGAAGTYLCFLNNDALLGEHSLSTAVRVFAHDPTTGAVGARILDPDGRLQEAGAIVWCDGTTNGYGFKDDPTHLAYQFRRPVDYCSGAFLVTVRTLFNDLGGFDADFSPGYYEDVDYCMRLWSNGRPVVYEPGCIVHHYGNAGSRHKGEALSVVIRNHEKFYLRWASELRRHQEPYGENISVARFAAEDARLRILAIVEEVPHRNDRQSSGEWTALHELVERGLVTCAATHKSPVEADYIDIDRRIELVDAASEPASVIREAVRDYDLFWLSRESSIAALAEALCSADELVAEVELGLPTDQRRFAVHEFLANWNEGRASVG